jgi:prepilin-type N-terminal cleavage/methylation domain-containing protein
MASTKQSGYSLVELLITISISLILTGIIYMSMRPLLLQSHVNSAYGTTLMVLRNTRNLAITQGHEYYVNFNPAGFPAGTIQVEYQPPAVGGGAAPPLQQVLTYSIPSDVTYAVQTGFPAIAPDGFGTGTAAIDFGQSLAGEPLNYVVFMPDGSSQDSFGNSNSGIVYMTQTSGTIYASRAITVWGATGRIRGWALGRVGAANTWVQQ